MVELKEENGSVLHLFIRVICKKWKSFIGLYVRLGVVKLKIIIYQMIVTSNFLHSLDNDLIPLT
ncbi:hypothetical protein NST21_18200 [Peribacillus sp. FSL K6-1552]|uniref:hypothetical protein n=1 Tax=Peribacillus sp. FSL K6-1552 TaxID=2954514 RepID=UPI0030FA0414